MLETIHTKCHKIFRDKFFQNPDDFNNDAVKFYGPSSACRIYDKLTEDGAKQDCIGENFNQLIQRIEGNWFENYKPTDDLDYYFFNYCLLLYLFVERVEIIFNVINSDGKSKLFNDFKHNNFKTLKK
jgi:hypothetical protein